MVIGAGPNGLVAANVLVDAGWSVCVLEAADEPGGSVRSAELTAPGFVNDVCSAFYPLAIASPALRELELESYGLGWRHAPLALAHVLPDDRAALLSRNVDETAESVAEFARGDADAWRREFAYWRGIRDELLSALLRPFPPVRATVRLLRRLGAPQALRLARDATVPARRLSGERFSGAGARLLLAGNALHTDLGPEDAVGGWYGWLLAMLAQDVGFPVPQGGAGALTDALVRRLESRGGTVECGRGVSRVIVTDNRATGVQDTHGDLVAARRAVVAGVAAPRLYQELIGINQLPDRLVRDLTRMSWDTATVKVDWALSAPIPWTAAGVARAGTVHLGGDLDGLTSVSDQLARRRVPRTPFLILGQLSTADPTRSPAGTEAVWAYTRVPHSLRWSPARLREHVQRMERVIERHAPGFSDLVLARHILGPADLERHNPNLVGGAINGGSAAPHQQLIFRPTPGLARADTVIDRLYLASASAHPGGGVHGASGANAAQAALRRDGPAGVGYAATVRAGHRLVFGRKED